jgi:hypothetical protein
VSGPLIHHYFKQIGALRNWYGREASIRVIAVEGDSVDTTRRDLAMTAAEMMIPLDLRTCNHGGKQFSSNEEPERFEALSKVGNAIFDGVDDMDDVLIYVECDLAWPIHTMNSLVEMALNPDQFDIFAPLTFAGTAFYDTWGFRKNGQRFSPFPPYHSDMNGGLCELDSAGSCLVMRSEVARNVRIKNNYCLVGWCEEARRQGYKIATSYGWRITHL